MARVKVKLADNIARVVMLDPEATKGATLGSNLYLPSGDVATPTTFASWLGTSGSSSAPSITAHRLLQGLTLGDDHPQYVRKDILTTPGDIYLRGSEAPERFAKGADGQLIRATETSLEWFTPTANPSAQIGLTAVNGTAETFMRSDAAPALNQGIAPTWTGQHEFTLTPTVGSVPVVLEDREVNTGLGLLGGGTLDIDRTLTLDLTADLTWTGLQTFTDQVTIEGTTPLLYMRETDASADNGLWGFCATAESFRAVAYNDAISSGNTWLLVNRTGTTVDQVMIEQGLLVAKGNIQLSSNEPLLQFRENDAALDTKNWEHVTVAGQYRFRLQNDADSAQTSIFTVNRTGMTVDYMSFLTQLRNQDGSASAPSVSFTNASTSGMYRSGTNQIGFASNGVGRMDILSSGQIRIRSDLGATQALSLENQSTTDGRCIMSFTANRTTSHTYSWGIDPDGGNAKNFALRDNTTSGAPIRVLLNTTGQWGVSDGAVGTPGLSFKDDLDTGMFRPAANELAFGVGGAERLHLTASHTYIGLTPAEAASIPGLGTITPAVNLTMQGNPLALGVAAGPNFYGARINGTLSVPTAMVSGQTVMSFTGYGYDGTTMAGAAGVYIASAGAWTGANHGGQIRFHAVAQDSVDALGTTTYRAVIGANVDGAYFRMNSDNGGDGTAAQPSYSFTSDTDTGIYRPGANEIAMVTGGTERMRIGSTGQVYISTTPAEMALVSGLNLSTAPLQWQGNAQYFRAAAAPVFRMTRFNGTASVPTTLLSGQTIGSYGFNGYNGTTIVNGATLSVLAAEDWTSTARGADYAFAATRPGTTTLAVVMRVKGLGQVRFEPLTADPATLEDGDVWYNSTAGKLRVRAAGVTVDLH